MQSKVLLMTPCKRESRKGAIITGITVSLVLNLMGIYYSSTAIRQVNWLKPIESVLVTELFENMSTQETKRPSDVKRNSSNKINNTVFNPAPVEVGEKITKSTPLAKPKTMEQKDQKLSPMKKLSALKPKRSELASAKNQVHDQYRRMMDFRIKKSFPTLDPVLAKDINKPVQIKVIIEPSSGKLKKVDVYKPSNSKHFDEAAILAIKNASPFPPIDVDIDQLAFIIPFSYTTAN